MQVALYFKVNRSFDVASLTVETSATFISPLYWF